MLDALAGCETVCIDTEFMRERTYYPELCLLQIAAGQRAWCIDALAIEDLSPFLNLCADPKITKVMHSARQDLEIFFALMAEPPQPVFDTQLAASLVGRGDQLSYAALVHDLLGVALDKTQTRTNWSQRPLTTAQINYALNDVIYLEAMRDKLSEELEQKGRFEWFSEDSKRLSDASLYVVEPHQACHKIKGIGNLSSEGFNRAVLLADWRERIAQTKNLPRTWVLKDIALIAIAEQAEVALQEHQTAGTLSAKQLRRWGSEIELALSGSTEHIIAPPYLGHGGLNASQKHLFKGVSQLVKHTAHELGLSPAVLANRKEMEKIARGARDTPLFHGWRAGVVGDSVLQFLSESTA